MIKDIKEKIITLLEELEDIVKVYDYPIAGDVTGYPYIVVNWVSQQAVELTNRQDRVTDIYEIKLVQEKLEQFKGRQQAEETTIDRVEDILETFRKHYTLDGMVLKTLPISTNKNYDDGSTRIIVTILIQTERTVDII